VSIHKVQLLFREVGRLLDILAGIAGSVVCAATVEHNPEDMLVLRISELRRLVGVDVILNVTRLIRIIHLAKEDVGAVRLSGSADEFNVLYLTDVHTVEGLGDHRLGNVSVDAGHIDSEDRHCALITC